VSVALAAVRRRARLEAAGDAAAAGGAGGSRVEVGALAPDPGGDRPTLLVADDDPALLVVMADLFVEAGYAVTRAESGNAAIREIERAGGGGGFDAIVADWSMNDGSGADLYRWLRAARPGLAERVVFLADDEAEDTGEVAPGRPIFRKGADSKALAQTLQQIVRRARGATA
jgi:CheY-like chemotaxis protein